MRKSRFTVAEMIAAIRDHDNGMPLSDVCQRLGIHPRTIQKWKQKYSGMEPGEAKRLQELERENAKLKRMLAEAELQKEALRHALRKKY